MAKQQKPRQINPRNDAKTKIMWVVMVFLLFVFFALPTVLLVFIGLMPTIAAFLIDRSKDKYSAISVASMNFSGIFPYIIDLWAGNNSIAGVFEILTVFALMAIYGAAGIGTLMFILIPPAVVSFLEILAKHRIVQLRAEQKILIEEWGEEVASATISAN